MRAHDVGFGMADSAHVPLKRCPVCGVMMMATNRDPQRSDPDRYECFNCGTIITLTTGDEREPDRPD